MNEVSKTADQLCEVMGLLSNKSRLMILCLLVDQEKSVGQLVKEIGAREPAVSQHLAILRRHGIVRARREGKAMIYSVVPSEIGDLLRSLYEIYCGDAAKPKES